MTYIYKACNKITLSEIWSFVYAVQERKREDISNIVLRLKFKMNSNAVENIFKNICNILFNNIAIWCAGYMI